jgi:large subunit ribosomal protein L17
VRHRNQRGKLERTSAHRKALMRNQVTSLLDFERIETTDAKAKVLRRVADKMITLGKRGSLHARRQALSVIRDRSVTEKVFDQLAARYAARPGGYTRVLKTRQRVGDAAPMSIVELVDGQVGGAPAAPAKGDTAEKAAKVAKPAKGAKPGKAAQAPKPEKVKRPKAERAPKAGGKGAQPGKGAKGARPAGRKAPSGDR